MIEYGQTKYGEIAVYSNDCYIRECLVDWKLVPDQAIIESIAQFIRNASVILDIGAHVGSHSLAYSHINPNAQIYAFEPQAKVFELLERNIKHNKRQNIKALNKAVGPNSGSIEMATAPSDGPNTDAEVEYGTGKVFNLGGLSIGVGGESVDMCSIDDMNLDCQFIKIDAEGFEPYVLAGLEGTIKRCWPVIFYEQNYKVATEEMKSKFGELATATEILQSYGYTIHSFPHDNYLAIKKGN